MTGLMFTSGSNLSTKTKIQSGTYTITSITTSNIQVSSYYIYNLICGSTNCDGFRKNNRFKLWIRLLSYNTFCIHTTGF